MEQLGGKNRNTMKTAIIIKNEWDKIHEYDFPFTMSKGDVVEYQGREYKVDCCLLEIEKSRILILLND